jgi:N-acetylglucosamine-6-sulfatase
MSPAFLKRFRVRAGAAGVALLAGCTANTIGPPPPPPPPPAPPNIILILTDDQDAASIAAMPNVQSLLVAGGTTFRNFFVSDPLCCPSRSSILRGQYVHNHQVLTNSAPDGGFSKFLALGHEQSTIGTWLKAAGYRTGFFGKYLNGYPGGVASHVPPGWDAWYSPISGDVTGGWAFSYQLNENGQTVAYGTQPADYFTDVMKRKSVTFIRDAVQQHAPFFVYLSTSAPHFPYTPAPRHQSAFSSAQLPRPPSFNEADVSDKPPWIRSLSLLSTSQITHLGDVYRLRLRSLLAIDELLGEIVDTLEVTGQLANTFIFFTSDNGYHLGEHRLREGKTTPYEEDILVRLMVRGPGVPAGRMLEQLVDNIDLAPTFAELAQATPPAFADGRSLVPLLRASPPAQWRTVLLVEYNSTSGIIPTYQAIRARDTLYVEYSGGSRELYDLIGDPFELQNKAASAPAAVIASLRARLAALKQCAAASCRTADNP